MYAKTITVLTALITFSVIIPRNCPAAAPINMKILGQTQAAQGQFERAISCFSRILSKSPKDIFARNQLGLALINTGNTRKAFEEFKEVLRQDPNNWFAKSWIEKLNAKPKPQPKSLKALPAGKARSSKRFDSIIVKAARFYNMDPLLIKAVIKAESNFNPHCTSSKGAMGLMQLMPETADDLGVGNPYNPYQNVMGGTRYLRSLLDRYAGNLSLALAAYNWGMGNLARNPGRMPEETRTYIARVKKYYYNAGRAYRYETTRFSG